MARCKSSPEVVRTKCELANRLKAIRTEQYGERGGPELARRLQLPIRTWYNYETGVTVPSEVLLRFIELTNVEPRWLLHGEGPKFRRGRPNAQDFVAESAPPGTVQDLLRQALELLERSPEEAPPSEVLLPRGVEFDPQADQVLVHVEDLEGDGDDRADAFTTLPMKRDWLGGIKRFHCLRVRGPAMLPLLADGAVVGVAERPEEPEALNGALVAARIGDRVVIRWLQMAGQVALLRAEDPAFEPEIIPIHSDDDGTPLEAHALRRVLWCATPHRAPGP